MAISLPQVPFKLTAQDMGGYDMAAALEKGINLGFLPREKKANLESTLLKNIYQQLVNKYTPEDYETTFANRRANTRLENLRSDFLPLEKYVDANNSLSKSSRSGGSYEFLKALNAMPAVQRGSWIAEHQDEYNQMLADASQGSSGGESTRQNVLQDLIFKEIQKRTGYNPQNVSSSVTTTQSNQSMDQPDIKQMVQPSPQQTQSYKDMQRNQVGQQQIPRTGPQSPVQSSVMQHVLPAEDRPKSDDPDIQKAQQDLNKAKFSSSQDQNDRIRDVGLMNVNRKLNSSFNNNRADGAKVFDNFLKNVRTPENLERFRNVAKLSGQTGEIERWVESKLPASMQSQAYKDFNWYQDEFQSAVTSTIKQMEKLNGDQKQIAALKALTSILYSPNLGTEDSIKAFNEGIRTLQQMSKSIFDSSEIPGSKGLYKRMYDLPDVYDNYVPLKADSKSDIDKQIAEYDRQIAEIEGKKNG